MHLLKARQKIVVEQRANHKAAAIPTTRNDMCASFKPKYDSPSHVLVGHADAGLSEGPGAENLQALEQRSEVDPEFRPLRALVLLEQAALEDALRLRELCSSRYYQGHGIARHLGIGRRRIDRRAYMVIVSR